MAPRNPGTFCMQFDLESLNPSSGRCRHEPRTEPGTLNRTMNRTLNPAPRNPEPRVIYSPLMTPTPTRARHIVALFAMALAVITYVDRAAINVSALYISKDLGLSTIQMGWAF